MMGIVYAVAVISGGFLLFQMYRMIKPTKELDLFHYLWLLLMISTFILRGRTTLQLMENPLDYAGLFRVSLVIFVAIWVGMYVILRGLPSYLNYRHPYILALFLYSIMGMFSAFYSPIPKLSLYKAGEVLIALFLVATFVKRGTLNKIKLLFDVNYLILFFFIASAWFWIFVKPEEAIQRQGVFNFIITGYFPKQDADMVSVNAALLAMGAYVRMRFYPYRKIFYRLLFLFGLFTLLAGQARTSIFGFLVALIYIYYILGENGKIIAMLFFIGLTFTYEKIYNFLYLYFLKGSRLETIMRIGGRLKWWKVAFPYFLTSPFWGHGFAAGVRGILLRYNPNIFSAHNSFLEIAVNVGIIGLTLFLWAYLGTFFTLTKRKDKIKILIKKNPIAASLLLEGISLMIILTARASTSFTQGEHGTAFLVFLSIMALAEKIRRGGILWERSS